MRIIQKEEGQSQSISAIEAYAIASRIDTERNMKDKEPFVSILEYMKACKPSMESAAWAERARKILKDGGMTEYEVSQVLNLSPVKYVDAKSLIPSLSRLENYAVNYLLNEIAELQSYRAHNKAQTHNT